MRMASPSSEGHTASELDSASCVIYRQGKSLLESGCQQACCQLSVEAPGAAPGLWLGLPPSRQWAPDLDGQQAPRPRLSANSNRLQYGPRQGASVGEVLVLPLLYSEAKRVVLDRMPLSLGKCPLEPPRVHLIDVSSTEVQCRL